MAEINFKTAIASQRVGSRFGMLTVTEHIGSNNRRLALYMCRCDCGAQVVKTSVLLTDKASCGCWGKRRQLAGLTKHGFSGRTSVHPMYSSWAGMKRRCNNPNNQDFKWYGGKGVTVCDRWASFENFEADMGGSYFKGATIDRIDPDLGYEPSNCRWVTREENSRRAALKKWAEKKRTGVK